MDLKDKKLQEQVKKERAVKDRLRHLQERVRRVQEDDILVANGVDDDQGRRLHVALSDPEGEPKKLFDKLPEGSLSRAVVDVSWSHGRVVCTSPGLLKCSTLDKCGTQKQPLRLIPLRNRCRRLDENVDCSRGFLALLVRSGARVDP